MDTQNFLNRNVSRMFVNILTIAIILAMALPAVAAAPAAAAVSPFVGKWEAIDVDGSAMDMSIGGGPQGPFQITWRDNDIAFCDGAPGIVRGTGLLNESDPNLLEADLQLQCFTTGASLDLQLAFRYHSTTNTLSLKYSFGQVTIWQRPGKLPEPPPALNLRVNVGDNWVAGFYEADHMVWITVAESDGVTVKATAEVMTALRDEWNGEPGFQVPPDGWLDAEGNPMEYPPDIRPYDWVFGWVDNGASAQVQVRDIRMIAFPMVEEVYGYNFPAGSEVTLKINDEIIQTVTVGPSAWDPNDIGAFFYFKDLHDLVPNDVVTLSSSEMEISHTVRNLEVTGLNALADTVSGKADPGTEVWVYPFAFGDRALSATAGEDGIWQVNFAEVGIDLIGGMNGRVDTWDQNGSSTTVDWLIPSPRMIAFPKVDEVYSYGFPVGSEVSLKINGEFIQTVTVGPSMWDPNDIGAFFSFPGLHDLLANDVVTLSGSGMEVSHIVRNLDVTGLDPVADTVTGTADPGTELSVYPFEYGDQALRVTANEEGLWQANFKEAGIDLVEGMPGRVDIWDENSSTTVDWQIP